MDYLYNVSHSFNVTPSAYSRGDVIYFCSDGEQVTYDESESLTGNSSYEEVMYRITNDYNRFNLHNTRFMSFAYFYTDTDMFFFNTNSIDYCGFELPLNNVASEIQVQAQYGEGHSYLDSLDPIENYYLASGVGAYTDNLRSRYGEYDVNLTDNTICWFDYANQKDNYAQQNAFVIRGENYSFYDTSIWVSLIDIEDSFTFYYGNPIQLLLDTEYTRGQSAGYSAGWANGIDQGYQQGLTAGMTGVDRQQANAFTYIGQGFNAVGQFLSIEILPNITLGLCFSIPMTLTLIMVIFKLVRK